MSEPQATTGHTQQPLDMAKLLKQMRKRTDSRFELFVATIED